MGQVSAIVGVSRRRLEESGNDVHCLGRFPLGLVKFSSLPQDAHKVGVRASEVPAVVPNSRELSHQCLTERQGLAMSLRSLIHAAEGSMHNPLAGISSGQFLQ